jgi:hypothetical protein
VEVQRKDNVHFLVAEMERWRGILDEDFRRFKE